MEEEKRIRFGFMEFDTHLRIAELLSSRNIRGADVALLQRMASCLDSSNRITLAMKTLAVKFARHPAGTTPSKKRLENAGLICRAYDPERMQAFYLIHPGFACVGSEQQRAIAWRRWEVARASWEEREQKPREDGQRRPSFGTLPIAQEVA